MRGEFQQLLLGGSHEFGDRQIFLPDDLTANELIEHALVQCGRGEQHSYDEHTKSVRGARLRAGHPWIRQREVWFGRHRALDGDVSTHHRAMLQSVASFLRDLCRGYWLTEGGETQFVQPRHTLLKSVEGIGKTAAFQALLEVEIRDDHFDDPTDVARFGTFAFRSEKQVEEKAAEYRNESRRAVVVRSFWSHYKEACAAVKERPMSQIELRTSPDGVLAEISGQQPAVFKELEERRAKLWVHGPFISAWTMLFMSHALAMRWHHSVLTRLWHHPKFDPDIPLNEQLDLQRNFCLSKVVFDEPDTDEFLHRLPEERYEQLIGVHAQCPGWKNRPTSERYELFKTFDSAVRSIGFEQFDELMRIDLHSLLPIEVDYNEIPFGFDNKEDGIYRSQHGKQFYIGPQTWMLNSGTQWIFLTTEDLVSEVISVASRNCDSRGS